MRSIPESLKRAWSALCHDVRTAVEQESVHDVLLRLTALTVVLYGASTTRGQVAFTILAAPILVLPAVLKSPLLWWSTAVVMLADNSSQWWLIDNHKYLLTYWVLGTAASLHQSSPVTFLRATARGLIVIVFACAVAWKIIGGHFLDGTFFTGTILLDGRLYALAGQVTGWTIGDQIALRTAADWILSNGIETVSLDMPITRRLSYVALGLSLTGLLLEAAVALTFALPGRRFQHVRVVPMMTFVGSVYFLLPVVGFATILCVLGLAERPAEDVANRYRYLLLFAIVQLIPLPWPGAVLR
jgi:hypothetical protein